LPDADNIYRDDIIFRDPKNMFQGIKDYKTIFWSLRFHGQLFFRMLYVDVQRIWESPVNVKDAGTVLKCALQFSFASLPVLARESTISVACRIFQPSRHAPKQDDS
jgi:hypothetical protein